MTVLDSELHKQKVLYDWVYRYPDRVHNGTDGVTPRRFLLLNHPLQNRLITGTIGDRCPATWTSRAERLF